ncbi:hypothetical protein H6G74_16850 [Nostoc spongiaeforme FACHB-130]|uniref:Uncharacterized protein n=1 Tax=Nostoc spongiaeforme FACHB-130 TaxID=1357510 RepID=A0ABR8FX25_9NOSO|nr:hypothetical protein [Nostoc spongiaeforme FACHB-130]
MTKVGTVYYFPQYTRLGGGTEPNIHAYFVGLRYRYTQPTILLTEPYCYIN